jgi:hypothetical protein
LKKIKYLVLGLLILFASIPMTVSANSNTKDLPPSNTKTEERAEANALLGRLYEIKDMDKHGMNISEKAKLGNEVKDINNRLRDIGGGIYISVGAIIIILLLILILL